MPHVVVAGAIHETGIKILSSRKDFNITYLRDNEDLTYRELIKDADALIIRTQPLRKEDIINAKNLKIVSRHGVGYDAVDVSALTDKKILLTIVGDVNSHSVAEHSMALILASFKRLIKSDEAVRSGLWSYRNSLESRELLGKKLLILGYGRVGKKLATMAKIFGMEVFAYDPFVSGSDWPEGNTVKVDSLDEGLGFADCISLNMPKTEKTLINQKEFGIMKNGVVLINTARGGILEEDAFLAALRSGKVGAAGIDVFDIEPPGRGNPLSQFKQVILTPHVAGLSLESAEAMAVSSVQNVLDYFDGNLDNSLIINEKQD